MIDNILLIIILLTLIYIILQKIEPMKDHNFEYLNSKSSTFLKNNVYSLNELIELNALPKCNKTIKFDYGSNYNLIVNNNISIYQDIIDPLQHTIDIDNINYNLTSLRWKLSKLSYNGIPVGLELHLVHQNFNSLHKLNIVLPLDLINNNKVESFKNINYTKMTNAYNVYTDTELSDYDNNKFIDPLYFQKEKKTEMLIKSLKNNFNLNRTYKDTKYSVNKLIPSELLLPNYECCKDSIGQELRFNFCDLQEILSKNSKSYYQLEDRDGNSYLINDPIPFDEKLGLHIINKLAYDDLTVFIKNN
jgi:hypothetical protein